jgi:ATP-dependent exoDNAse (exonuclease V) alpha subunit
MPARPEGVYADGKGGWYFRGFRTAAEAAHARAELLGGDRRTPRSSAVGMTLDELLDRCLDADERLSVKTRFDYRKNADVYVRPLLGDRRVRESQGSVAVLAATNDSVHRLNERLQAERIAAGELSGPGTSLPSGQRLHVGDQVATRQNDRTLRTDRGAMVRNRARWIIEAVDPTGSVVVTSPEGSVVVPAEYVAEKLVLAYAETVHAAQGRTVDHSLFLADGTVDAAAAYVALTRGRHSNHAHVVSAGDETGIEVLERNVSRVDRPAVELDHAAGRLVARREPDPPGIAIGL